MHVKKNSYCTLSSVQISAKFDTTTYIYLETLCWIKRCTFGLRRAPYGSAKIQYKQYQIDLEFSFTVALCFWSDLRNLKKCSSLSAILAAFTSLQLILDKIDRFQLALVMPSPSCSFSSPNFNETWLLKCVRSHPLQRLHRRPFALYITWNAEKGGEKDGYWSLEQSSFMYPASLCV